MTNFYWDKGIISLIQVAVLVLGSPVLIGLMRKVRCRFEGRIGPPILQPLYDLRKLISKERIRPSQTSWVFATAPLIFVSSVLVAIAITPLFSTHPVMSEGSNLFVITYLLLVGSCALLLAGLDTGTAFGGMGSSRGTTIGALTEPALLMTILCLSITAHSSNLPVILHDSVINPSTIVTPERLFGIAALIIVTIAESGRLPVDNPSTHLELTMIHEAMILEYSGFDLALINAGESMRLALLLGIVSVLIVPWGIATSLQIGSITLGLLTLIIKISLLGVAIAVFEVFTAKMRLFRLPELLAGAFILALLGVVSGLMLK